VKVLRTFDKVANQQELEVLLARLQKIISEFPTFQITLRGLSFFPTSIYVKVEDEFDQLRMINKRIISEFGNLVDKGEYDGDSYIPHLTIATFNTKEAEDLISKVKSKELQEIEIGRASIFELEAVEARMYLLLGPEDTQDQGFRNLRTLQLMGGRNR
jgi:2'-5' RNA ligase